MKNQYDWNQIRAFISTVDSGSLSSAARNLNLTQPTLSRQVAALEENLGVVLFERSGKSLLLTPIGQSLYNELKDIPASFEKIPLLTFTHSQILEGDIIISATDMMSLYHLPPILEKIHQAAPEVRVKLHEDNSISDLQKREADIAIRHIKPTEPELISKKIKEIPIRLYASRSFISTKFQQHTSQPFSQTSFIAYGDKEQFIEAINVNWDIGISNKNIHFNTQSSLTGWELVKQGLGISMMSENVATQTPEIECILPQTKPLYVPVYLVCHREINKNVKLRFVFDFIYKELKKTL